MKANMKASEPTKTPWKTVISADINYFNMGWKELWRYKFLLTLLIRKNIILRYRQTILGVSWIAIQPLLSSFVFLAIFSKAIGISTDEVPPFLFYMSGNIFWLLFASSFNKISSFHVTELSILTKVYMPKIIMPFSYVFSDLVNLGIYFIIFLGTLSFYIYGGSVPYPSLYALGVPLLLLLQIIFTMGIGSIFSYLTMKYKDLGSIISYFVQFLMYLTPVIYPLSTISNPTHKFLLLLNPMTSVVEYFRYAFLGQGEVHPWAIIYSIALACVLYFIGIFSINYSEKTYSDVI